MRYLLGDIHYNAPNVRQARESSDRFLVVPQYGAHSHTDIGKEVHRIFHKLRPTAIENFKQFKGIFDGHGQVPTKGLINTQRFALRASLSINLPCCIGSSIAWTCGSASKLS